MSTPTKGSLTGPRRRLLESMQELNHGTLYGLQVRRGEPVLDPSPRKVVNYRFPCDNGPRAELAADDFVLKKPIVELFQHFDRLGDGVIDELEIKGGLPFRMSQTVA